MLAKFDETFDNSPILKKDSKALKINALQHLDDIEQKILRISTEKGWKLNTSDEENQDQ